MTKQSLCLEVYCSEQTDLPAAGKLPRYKISLRSFCALPVAGRLAMTRAVGSAAIDRKYSDYRARILLAGLSAPRHRGGRGEKVGD